MKRFRQLALGALALLAVPALAADFDGSKSLICAPVSAMDCVRGDDCVTGLPEEIGAPAFMRLDFAKKSVVGPKRSSDMLLIEKTGNQTLLQGREGDFGWTIVLEAESGEMTVTFANRKGAFVLFGACTPL
jgi:hypothetical protein